MNSVKSQVIIIFLLTIVFSMTMSTFEKREKAKLANIEPAAYSFVAVASKPSRCQKNIDDAERLLSYLRVGSEYYDGYLKRIEALLTECHLTLEDIGTDQAELDDLRHKGYLKSAKLALDDLRSNNSDYFLLMLDLIFRYVEEKVITLDEIGTSRQELRQLVHQHYKMGAKKALLGLRHDPDNFKLHLIDLDRNIEDGRLSLKEIGTSRRELQQLKKKGYEHAVKSILRSLPDKKGAERAVSLKLIRIYMTEGKLKPKNVGLSRKEYKRLS